MSAVLVRGSKGRKVQILQHLLNSGLQPGRRLRLDGDFGSQTEVVVRAFQAQHRLVADGVVGPRTWAALIGPRTPILPGAPTHASTPTVGRTTAPPVIEPTLPENVTAPWFRIAELELGVAELPGVRHNSRIVEYHSATSLRAQTDEVPWCSSFVNWCLTRAGKRGTNDARAISWLNWGRELSSPQAGAITIIHRDMRGRDRATGSSSGNHVAFYVGGSGSAVRLLGGNQSDMVKYSNFHAPPYEILGYRWPI